MPAFKTEMPATFSPEFQAVIAESRVVALQTGAPEITSDHILIAALSNARIEAAEAIRRGGAEPEEIRLHLIDRYPMLRDEVESKSPVTLTDEAESAMIESLVESERWNSEDVMASHFVMAVLRLKTPMAARTLAMYGLEYENVVPR